MWKLCRAVSWQGSQGAVHTRGVVCGCRGGSRDAELLGNGRQVSFIVSLSGGRMRRGRGGTTLAEASPLAILAVFCTNLLLARFPRTSCVVQGGRVGQS